MKMSPSQLAKAVVEGKFAPVYYFFGDDDYRMIEAIRFLREKFLPAGLFQSNSSRVDLNSQKFTDVRDELMAAPFFGERSVVTIVNPQRLSQKQVKEMLKLLETRVESRVVIFYTRAANKPNWKSKLPKTLEPIATLVEFPRLTIADAQKRVLRAMKTAGIEIEPAAALELAEMTSCDSGRLNCEIEKLIGYGAGAGALTVETVREVASETVNRNVYQLADFVVAGNVSAALEAFAPVLDGGDTPTGVLYWLGQGFLDLYYVKGGRKLPYNKERFRSKYERQARQWSLEQIETALSLIASCEAGLKGGISDGPTEGQAALHELILSLCSLAESQSPRRTLSPV